MGGNPRDETCGVEADLSRLLLLLNRSRPLLILLARLFLTLLFEFVLEVEWRPEDKGSTCKMKLIILEAK